MSTPFPIVPNNAVSGLAANYTAGSGVMSVNPGDGARFGTPTPERPLYITVVSQNTNLFTVFRCTGRSTDLLTGLVAIDSTADRNYVVGDPIRVAIVGQHFEDLYTAVGALEDSGAVLPSQTGNSGKVLTTDGTSASWASFVGLPTQSGQSGKYLTTNGTTASWVTLASVLPAQTGNTGKYLTTDGTTASWATIASALPTQTGNSGKYLTTDGTTASWVSLASTLPTQTGNTGKYLTTDGTTASWAALTGVPSQTGNSGKFLSTDGTNPTWTALTADTLLPTQTSNSGKVLTTDGTTVSWATPNAGTVTSVDISVPAHLTVSGNPVTAAGTITIGLALQNANTVQAGPTTGSPAAPTFRALVAGDIPNLDAAKITSGTLAVAQGGTGQATASAAINALVPAQTGNSGKYLSTDGTSVSWVTATPTGALLQAPTTTAANTVQPTSASVTPLSLECAASQTAPLLAFLNSSGTTISQVSKDGYVGVGVAPTYQFHSRNPTYNTISCYWDGINDLSQYNGIAITPADGNRHARIASINGSLSLIAQGSQLNLGNIYDEFYLQLNRPVSSSTIVNLCRIAANVSSSNLTGTAGYNLLAVNLLTDTSTSTGQKRLVSFQIAGVEKSGVDLLGRPFCATTTSDPVDTPATASMVFNTANNTLWIYNTTGTPGWKSVTFA